MGGISLTYDLIGVLVVLDAHASGIIYRDLIPEYANFGRTIYEDDFGDVVVDVNYLNVGESSRLPNLHMLNPSLGASFRANRGSEVNSFPNTTPPTLCRMLIER